MKMICIFKAQLPNVKYPMERTGILIKRLLEQYESGALPENLLVTVRMLLGELQQANNINLAGQKKVSVIMPNAVPVANDDEPVVKEKTEIKEEKTIAQKPAQVPVEEFLKIKSGWQFDPHDIPTLVHQNKANTEINDTIANKSESLNDKLKPQQAELELGNVLQDAPVRDLKKAIGINDRFLFINELFRGDENMYERSIKTINAFSILPEAEYWIQRELKVKQGWNEDNEAVKLFDQLIKRRFS